MKTITYKLKDLEEKKEKKVTLKLGYVGENEHVQIRIDCAEIWKDYPAAVASLAVEPPEGEKYPAIVTRDGDMVCWTVKDSDLANDGYGRIQLTFTEGSEIQKTVICRTKVDESIIGSGTAPDPIQDWIDEANEVVEEAREAAAAAEHQPRIGQDGYWEIWDLQEGQYVTTGVKAQGEQGDPGPAGEDGAPGQDGHTPEKGVDYWTEQDLAAMAADVVSDVIDDTAGDGDTNKTWSADKLDEEFGELLTDITKVEDAVDGFALNEIELVEGKYVDLSGNTVNICGYPIYDGNSESYSCGMMPCIKDDKFIVSGSGGSSTRLWAFVSQDGNIISKANANAQETAINLTAPTSARWLIVHTNNNEKSYKINNFSEEARTDALRWNQGSISGTTGLPIESTTRIYSDMIKCTEKPIIINVGTGLKYSFRIYNRNGELVNGSANWSSENSYVLFQSGEYRFRVICAYTNDGAITPTDTINLYFTEETLSGVLSIKEEIKLLDNKLFGETKITEWEQGSLSTSDSSEISSTTRIRTGHIAYTEHFRISIDTKSKVSYRAYKANGSLISSSDWMLADDVIMMPPNTATFRLVYARQTDETITPSIQTNIVLTTDVQDEISGENDSKETYTNKFNGNLSIRAAKVINFNDGTEPVTDWYLLESVNNSFYMSKDLKTKKFLFSFVPPYAGYASDWSVGITASNDVILVADAAGLSTSRNGRLSDANRVNPVYYLASENYSIMHTLDFGTSKKPCGWLENVGFCLLPNGDIVIAEYTRGTVKTANVWHVSGDFTNPSNWSATWTTNIIDVMDSTTPGIKHCHEVQYDFFTGVLYFGTGDSETGSYNYYSTDNGATWSLLYGEDKARCRRLNYVFTEDKVYWASDSYDADHHYFYIGERDGNGLVDVENATAISLGNTNNQACYGCVYLEELNIIVMMDRIDNVGSNKLEWYCYDINAGEIIKIGNIYSIGGSTSSYLGFRCKYVDWYPVRNDIIMGFNPKPASENPDVNVNALCGNQGGVSGNGSTRINNMTMHIYKKASGYGYRATTMWI